QYLPVARRKLLERGLDARPVAFDLHRLIGSGRALLRLGREQREMPSLPGRTPRIVPRHVRRHDEQPPPRVVGFVDHGPSKGLLGQVLRTLGVPHLAVQEPHECAVRGAVDLGQVLGHWTKCFAFVSSPGTPTESAALPVTTTALSWSEPESACSARERCTASAPAWSRGAIRRFTSGRCATTPGSCTR